MRAVSGVRSGFPSLCVRVSLQSITWLSSSPVTHVGDPVSSSTRLPVLYVYGRGPVDTAACVASVSAYLVAIPCATTLPAPRVFVASDCEFEHALPTITERLVGSLPGPGSWAVVPCPLRDKVVVGAAPEAATLGSSAAAGDSGSGPPCLDAPGSSRPSCCGGVAGGCATTGTCSCADCCKTDGAVAAPSTGGCGPECACSAGAPHPPPSSTVSSRPAEGDGEVPAPVSRPRPMVPPGLEYYDPVVDGATTATLPWSSRGVQSQDVVVFVGRQVCMGISACVCPPSSRWTWRLPVGAWRLPHPILFAATLSVCPPHTPLTTS